MKIFLDDIRIPTDCLGYMGKRIGKDSILIYTERWQIVRNYSDFCLAIEMYYPEITHISFDHDIHDSHYTIPNEEFFAGNYEVLQSSLEIEKTGYDAAKWMLNFYQENNLKLPIIYVHSMNPVGRENIEKLVENYKKHHEF